MRSINNSEFGVRNSELNTEVYLIEYNFYGNT